jgi:hypothetical protein
MYTMYIYFPYQNLGYSMEYRGIPLALPMLPWPLGAWPPWLARPHVLFPFSLALPPARAHIAHQTSQAAAFSRFCAAEALPHAYAHRLDASRVLLDAQAVNETLGFRFRFIRE